MQYLDDLARDHKHMRILLGIFGDQINLVKDTSREADFELMRDIIVYATRYSDSIHHPREKPLFEALVAASPELQPTIARLGSEHSLLAHHGANLRTMIAEVLGEGLVERSLFVTCAYDYLTFYEYHMAAEDELFAVAGEHLKQADFTRIHETFKASEDPVFGPTVATDLKALRRIVESDYS